MKTLRLVILDCDGVLFHSHRANEEFYVEVMRRMDGPPLSEELRYACHTLAARAVFERQFADDPGQVERAVRTARAMDYAPFYRYMEPVEELRETLDVLARGRRVAMATNRSSSAPGVVRHFELDPPIEFVSMVGERARPKPEPDVVVRCLEHFEVEPAQAVYVGDADSDRLAAERAGTGFVGVGDRVDSPVRVDGFRDVLDVLRLV